LPLVRQNKLSFGDTGFEVVRVNRGKVPHRKLKTYRSRAEECLELGGGLGINLQRG